MLELEEFKNYVKAHICIYNLVDELDDHYVRISESDDLNWFIDYYEEMLHKLMGIEEDSNECKAINLFLYDYHNRRLEDEDELDEKIEDLYDKLTISTENKAVKKYYSVEEDTPSHTGALSGNNDFDWEGFFNDLLDQSLFKVKIFKE